MSGFGRGMGHGGGDPEYSRDSGSRKGQYGREEVKGKEVKSHKEDTSDWVPTCHGCGVKGHKRPECPNRIGSIRNFGHFR